MPPGIDVSGILREEIRREKKKYERALAEGDYKRAAAHARRLSTLLRTLASTRSWSRGDLLELASQYEARARELEAQTLGESLSPERVRGTRVSIESGGSGELAELDSEFERAAEALIVRASVSWDDIAGLDEVKRSLIEALFYSVARPSVPGVRVEPPRRFLLYGPPGTGKTMLAMAASNMLGATFFYVSVDRVLSRYVGDSPRMISAIFRVARRRAPSIVFFDEVETLAARRDSPRGEAASGLVQTLLTELDGFKNKTMEKPVIVMAATNKPWMLDEAILSRFEKRIYVPLPDRRARKRIFQLNLEEKGFKIEGITYDELADLTEGYSGRDIATVAREAIMRMLRRANPDIYEKLSKIDPSRLENLEYRIEPVTREDLLEAIKIVKPTVDRNLIRRYEEWAKTH